jgi:hypothetical protein
MQIVHFYNFFGPSSQVLDDYYAMSGPGVYLNSFFVAGKTNHLHYKQNSLYLESASYFLILIMSMKEKYKDKL